MPRSSRAIGRSGAERPIATTRRSPRTFPPVGVLANSIARRESGSPTTRRTSSGSSTVGSQTYGNPVIADGRLFVGTNNGAGYLKRYPGRRRSRLPAVLQRERMASSCGSIPARSCRPGASTTGRFKASVVRRWWKETACGSSPAVARLSVWTPKGSTTARTMDRLKTSWATCSTSGRTATRQKISLAPAVSALAAGARSTHALREQISGRDIELPEIDRQ